MASFEKPRKSARDDEQAKSKPTEGKAEGDKPAPKPVFQDWAAI